MLSYDESRTDCEHDFGSVLGDIYFGDSSGNSYDFNAKEQDNLDSQLPNYCEYGDDRFPTVEDQPSSVGASMIMNFFPLIEKINIDPGMSLNEQMMEYFGVPKEEDSAFEDTAASESSLLISDFSEGAKVVTEHPERYSEDATSEGGSSNSFIDFSQLKDEDYDDDREMKLPEFEDVQDVSCQDMRSIEENFNEQKSRENDRRRIIIMPKEVVCKNVVNEKKVRPISPVYQGIELFLKATEDDYSSEKSTVRKNSADDDETNELLYELIGLRPFRRKQTGYADIRDCICEYICSHPFKYIFKIRVSSSHPFFNELHNSQFSVALRSIELHLGDDSPYNSYGKKCARRKINNERYEDDIKSKIVKKGINIEFLKTETILCPVTKKEVAKEFIYAVQFSKNSFHCGEKYQLFVCYNNIVDDSENAFLSQNKIIGISDFFFLVARRKPKVFAEFWNKFKESRNIKTPKFSSSEKTRRSRKRKRRLCLRNENYSSIVDSDNNQKSGFKRKRISGGSEISFNNVIHEKRKRRKVD